MLFRVADIRSSQEFINKRHNPEMTKTVRIEKKEKEQSPAEDQAPQRMIQWAGSLHSREDFNKKRDNLASWTEVLFSH